MQQSPINLDANDSVELDKMALWLNDYRHILQFKISNTHHTVKMTPIKYSHRSNSKWPSVQLSGIPGYKAPPEYELHDIHFHWGDSPNSGSEHSFGGSRGAMEMHLVHKRKGLEINDAQDYEDSLLVIGVIIQMTPDENKISAESDRLWPIWREFTHLNGTSKPLEFIFGRLNWLLPKQKNWNSFYWYRGSLTTPPCFEIVMWVVMRETIWIRPDDYHNIQHLLSPIHEDDTHFEFVGPNVRARQETNGRYVFKVGGNRQDIIYQHPNTVRFKTRSLDIPNKKRLHKLSSHRMQS